MLTLANIATLRRAAYRSQSCSADGALALMPVYAAEPAESSRICR